MTALKKRFQRWDIYISDRLEEGDYTVDPAALKQLAAMSVQRFSELHLSVSMRSFRAEALSSFISHVVENRPGKARDVYRTLETPYPIWLTRDLATAKDWLRRTARGS